MGAEQFYNGGQLPAALDSTNHLVVRQLLPEYVMLRVLGQQLPPVWQVLEYHLAQCSICRSAAETLEYTMTEAYRDVIPAQAAPPAPDLSFLQNTRKPWPATDSSKPWPPPPNPAQKLQPISMSFSPALLAHSQVHMLARSGDARLRYAHTITPTTADEPTITIEVLASDDQPMLGIVRICVELPDRSPFDQAGSQIILQVDQQYLSDSTDQNGNVVFNEVPLDDIASWQLTVHPQKTP